jgi:hypothetical protein
MTDFIITGTADEILELCAGPRQHNAHCMGWRHHLYLRDYDRREANVRAWAKQHIKAVNDAREAREAAVYQMAAE